MRLWVTRRCRSSHSNRVIETDGSFVAAAFDSLTHNLHVTEGFVS